ncbi:MAG TPA: hypothetical protein VL863_03840 [bacterium]|jgi:hypothetical protein|nr:hypothetical protein [bacterium]
MFALNKFAIRFFALGLCLVFITGCHPAKPATDIGSRPEASLEEVNEALVTWNLYKASYPSNLVELESAPFFKKRLPTPPAGKKLVLDRTGKAVFVNE